MAAAPQTSQAMVGASAAMEGVLRWLRRAAQLQSPIVIEGEPGVGKVHAAKVLHALSPRASASLVVLNAPAVSGAELLEALEHEARREHPGTVVVRRVEDLHPRVQPLLVRALKERYGEGGRAPRIVATAFRSLQQAVRDGSFREDLYFRLSVLPLIIPPLRERKEDIPALVRFALGNDATGRPRALSLMAMERVLAYPWPENVRELLEVMTHLRDHSSQSELGVDVLPEALARGPSWSGTELALYPPPTLIAQRVPHPPRPAPASEAPDPPAAAAFPVSEHLPFKEAKAQLLVVFEREYLARLLKRCKGSITRTAHESGLHRKSIERLVKKYGLRRRRSAARD